jgi:hypothetical protein
MPSVRVSGPGEGVWGNREVPPAGSQSLGLGGTGRFPQRAPRASVWGEPGGFPQQIAETKLRKLRGRGCLRSPAPSSGGAAGHLAGAVVAEVGLLRAAAGVGIRQAKGCAFAFTDFRTAAVAHEHCLPGHVFSSCGGLALANPNQEWRSQSMQLQAHAEFATIAAARVVPAPHVRARYRGPRRPANAGGGNRRAFGRPGTARRPQG